MKINSRHLRVAALAVAVPLGLVAGSGPAARAQSMTQSLLARPPLVQQIVQQVMQQMMGRVSVTQTTPSYSIRLDIGPAATILTPDQAATATSGEVVMSMSNMSNMSNMSSGSMGGQNGMSMSGDHMGMGGDQMGMTMGDPMANHYLAVHVADATGAAVMGMVPSITITNQATGQSRTLDEVMEMYDLQMGQGGVHFGDNIHLDDGTYTVTVTVGSETATFGNLMVSGGM